MDAQTPATKPLRRVQNLGLGRALAESPTLEKHGKTALAAATAKQLRHRLLSLKKLAANPEIYTWWCSTPLGVHRLGKISTLHLTMCAGGGQKENTFRQVIQGYADCSWPVRLPVICQLSASYLPVIWQHKGGITI